VAARFVPIAASALRMSLARPIHRGTRYLLTRRVAHRQFFLRPSELTNRIFLYALAYALSVTGVLVHAVVVMSNHIHLVVTDPAGRLPQFLHILHRHVSKCMNASLGRKENFWSSDQPSVVALESDLDVLDKTAYVIANPTAAGLVEDPAEWPGVISPECGMTVTAARPEVFYRAKGKMPACLELKVTPPELSSFDSVEAVVAKLRELVALKVRAARDEVAKAKKTFFGREGVLSASRSGSASTPERLGSRRPRFAARGRARRSSVVDRLRAFHASYARALQAWRAGDRGVVFPAGTYLMRVRHGVLVEAGAG
jgi:REP element-mobilizing transposase RayT